MSRRSLSSRAVSERYGGAHLRTLARWEASGVLPPPDLIINRRKFWYEDTLDEMDRQRTIAAGAEIKTAKNTPSTEPKTQTANTPSVEADPKVPMAKNAPSTP